jgi:glycine C-acetyltransferase
MFTDACRKPLVWAAQEIEELKKASLHRSLFVLGGPQEPVSVINGRTVINLSSNNYLGLTTHPEVVRAAKEAIDVWGVGTAAVRTIIGTMEIHERLERRLAEFKGTEAAIVFQSGFATNVAVNQSILTDESDYLISDELNHASIIDGARLAKAQRRVYKHKNMSELRAHLEEARAKKARRTMVVTDGVFSMDGDVAPLPDIVELCERHEAVLMVDDAHASGVMGKNGRGTPSHFGLSDRIQIQIGTLSKAFAAMGGYAASTAEVRDYLIHKARPFLFSSSHPPSVIATCLAVVDLLLKDDAPIVRLWENARYFKGRLKELGFDTGASETPITPIIVGDTARTMRLSDRLFEEGVFAQGIGYPTVARGKERIRTIVSAAHRREDLDRALEALKKVGRELQIIR